MLPPGCRKLRPSVGLNTNLDNFSVSGTWNSTGPLYYNTILRDDIYRGDSPFLTHIREAVLKNGVAPATLESGDGVLPDLTQFTRIMDLPFVSSMSGGILCEPNVERVAPYDMAAGEQQTPDVLNDAAIWGPRKESEVRWKLACIANAFPNCRGPRGIWGWLGPNEADFNGYRFQQVYKEDDKWPAGGPAQVLALDRLVLLVKWMEAELRSNRWWTKRRHPGILFMPATSSQALKTGSWSGWTAKQMYAHQDATMIGLVDAITTTWHHTQSTFERRAPGSANRVSAYWAWDALKNAQTVWEASGKGPAPQLPVCATEYGVDFEDRMPTAGYYSTSVGVKHVKVYRLGLAACARFFWALPTVTIYSITGSGANGQNFYEKPALTKREPETSAMREVFDDRKYMLRGSPPWPLPITAKTWAASEGQEKATGFHRGYTWAVAAPLYNVPAGTLAPTDPPMPNWLNVTIADNLVTSSPASPAFTQAFLRPVILPRHGTYRVTAEVTVSGGGQIALVVRGYDFLDGLVESSSASSSSGWVTLAVTFRTVPHHVLRLPNLAQACIMLEHNGVGTAQFRNVVVVPI